MVRLLLLLVLTSCSIQSRKDQENLRVLFSQKNFVESESYLNKSDLAEEDNKLLYLMDLASIRLEQKRYKDAADLFVEANKLVDKLYTKSIRKAVLSNTLNENFKVFYGSIYERSLLYFYQALSFYHVYLEGGYTVIKKTEEKTIEERVELSAQEKRSYQSRVRSTLIAWDSFFQEIRRSSSFKSFLKQDLLAKVLASTLHKALGSRRDLEIAYILDQDARNYLVELGPAQKLFNTDYVLYNKELREAYDAGKSGKGLKSKSFTPQYTELLDQLEFDVLAYAKKNRSNDYSRLYKRYKPSKKVVAKLNTKNKSNITFLLQEGLISQRVAKDYTYNLRTAVDNIEDKNTRALVNGIGVPVLTYFALGPLGLGFVSHHGNVSVYSRHSAGEVLTKEVGLEFELPYAAPSHIESEYFIAVKNGQKTIKTSRLTAIGSLSDTSFIYNQEVIDNSFKVRGTRIAIKYIVAILAAYKTYETVRDSSGELFAKPAALAQFLLSQKGIKETEKVDVRYWSVLPDTFLKIDLSLPKGDFDIVFQEKKSGKVIRTLNLGKITIDGKRSIFSDRLF